MNRLNRRIVAFGVAMVLVVGGVSVAILKGSSHRGANGGSAAPVSAKSSATSSSAYASSSSTALAPAKGVLFGASVGTSNYQQTGRIASVDQFQAKLGAKLSVIHIFRTLDQPIGTLSDLHYLAQNRTLLISWAGTDTNSMASGQVDSIIAARAEEVAALKVPVFFEFRWEMDRPNLASVVHGPAQYIAAWKRVRKIFADHKVTNAEFVWCPLASGFVNNRAQPYYPGDDEVDWICADVYPRVGSSFTSFASLAAPFLHWAASVNKPIIFGEFGVPASYGDQRPGWLTAVADVVRANPRIKAMLYFNSDSGSDKYALNSDPAALQACTQLMKLLGTQK